MNESKSFRDVSTSLDLNGPILSITTQPSSTASCNGGTVSFVGLATATFPTQTPTNPATNTGTLSYQWYRIGTGELSDGVFSGIGTTSVYVSGSNTTTLTLSNVISPDEHTSQYYFVTTHSPSAYGNPGIGAGKSTGNAINNPITSDIATLTVYPLISNTIQPSDTTTTINNNATFTADAILTDDTQGSISYQWFVNGAQASNEVKQTTSSVTNFTTTYTADTTITIPDDATNVSIRVYAAAGGFGGSDTNGSGGAGGSGRSGLFTLANGGRILDFSIGSRGASPGGGGTSSISSGGRGGTGNSSGSGGGGASGCFVYDRLSSTYVIAAGGGAGGGGGSYNDGGNNGENAGDWQSVSGGLTGFTSGSQGEDSGGIDGGGGGGGAGGYRGGSGGARGQDNPPLPPPPPPPPPPSGGGGGRGCFISETKVLMSDSSEKSISDVKVGDYVMNKSKTQLNKVVFIEKHSEIFGQLYSPTSDLKPFATTNHMLYKDGKCMVVDNGLYQWMGSCETILNPIIEPINGREVYNLWVTGDGSYIVNGYGTHSIMFDGGFMRNCYEQGSMSYEDIMHLMKEYTEEKPKLLYGSFLVNKFLGKLNFKLLNKICANILLSDDTTLRKKAAQQLMKILPKIRSLVK